MAILPKHNSGLKFTRGEGFRGKLDEAAAPVRKSPDAANLLGMVYGKQQTRLIISIAAPELFVAFSNDYYFSVPTIAIALIRMEAQRRVTCPPVSIIHTGTGTR